MQAGMKESIVNAAQLVSEMMSYNSRDLFGLI
jgi:hypothetical protein